MFSINGKTIKITRGDTAHISMSIYKGIDEKYIMKTGDRLFFTVKTNTLESTFLFQKTMTSLDVLQDGNVLIKIAPSDTNNFDYDTFYYDIELKTNTDDVYTIVPPSEFIILPEITFPTNEVT